MIEVINGKAQMAYAGETPWHGLGARVPADLTPEQMLDAAGLNWRVEKAPTFAVVNDDVIDTGRYALVRDLDKRVIDVVTEDWVPVQNIEAFEFFNDFIAAGDMQMHTAGSLRDGQVVWALAKVNESFEIFGNDQIDSYLLFSNFHKYGVSTDVRFTPIRVVCNNTLTLSLGSRVENMAKFTHRQAFDADLAKEMLGIAKEKLQRYKEMATYLGSKRAKDEDIVQYFKRIFPGKEEETLTKKASQALSVLHSQPGAEYAEGSWWQPFNAVTFMTDHLLGRRPETRLASAWYGASKKLKTEALSLAVEFADAA